MVKVLIKTLVIAESNVLVNMARLFEEDVHVAAIVRVAIEKTGECCVVLKVEAKASEEQGMRAALGSEIEIDQLKEFTAADLRDDLGRLLNITVQQSPTHTAVEGGNASQADGPS